MSNLSPPLLISLLLSQYGKVFVWDFLVETSSGEKCGFGWLRNERHRKRFSHTRLGVWVWVCVLLGGIGILLTFLFVYFGGQGDILCSALLPVFAYLYQACGQFPVPQSQWFSVAFWCMCFNMYFMLWACLGRFVGCSCCLVWGRQLQSPGS